MTTVTISPIAGYSPHLKMKWDAKPIVPDIQHAFNQIAETLDKADVKVFVVVDISSKPRFPLAMTIAQSARIHRHPNMGDWLVVGENTMARYIGSAISSLSSSQVLWFKTENDALKHLTSVITRT